ncbi:RE1-silencing transcription factor-like [Conger conger]|uniref:RE1-silencing transcription factor-like n=1 Tax=Conger conger TaxID=82655 RepID=UPI002A5A494B|nr:RE1-silencing transcription factor-like [Conger conger]
MAAQTVYPVGVVMFTPLVGVAMGGEETGVTEIPRTDLAAPQLVMLANVALTSEGGGSGDYSPEEKQMVELKTVGSSCYSDSEDEGLVHCGYADGTADSHHADASFDIYPETPQAVSSHSYKGRKEQEQEEEEEEEKEEEDQETEGEGKGEGSPSSPTVGCKRKRIVRQLMENCRSKKKPFHCKPCQYEAECEEEFVDHIRVHSAKKLLVAEQAQEEEDELANGAEPVPEGGGEGAVYTKGVIRCERCGYNTNRYDHYMAHLKHHSKEGDSQRVYKCTICTYTTISQYHWKKHLRNHFPSKLYTCGQCCYFSDRKNNYVQHIRTHTGERPFRCSYCKYSSSQKTHLTRHMRTHSGERPFKCDSCSYLAANQHEVTRHARQVHNGPKPLSCPHCQYKTADRSNYKKHVELHVNPRQFLCPVCTYAASKKCNLQYHVKSRHPDCSDITLDVSKVKLRIKKPESGSPTYYSVGKEARYVLTGIKEGKVERKSGRREGATGGGGGGGEGEGVAVDSQPTPDPINLSTKKPSKANPLSTAAKKEQRDKTHKRSEERETSKRREEREASKRRVERETPKRRVERETSKRREERETPKRRVERETPKRRVERETSKRVEERETSKRVEERESSKRVEERDTSKRREERETSKRVEERETPKRETVRKTQKSVVAEERRGVKPGERKERVGGKVTRKAKANKIAGVSAETQPRRESKVRKMANAKEEKEEREQNAGDAERAEEERAAKERAEREERERMENERVERERVEKGRLERERAEKDRLEMERAAKERVEMKRQERERLEKERIEKERAERERVEKERMEKERVERERAEKERLERERAEKERLEKEREEKERMEMERAENERMENERAEREREENERMEKERAERKKERMEKERAERERVEKERMEKERAERESVEKERKSEDADDPIKSGSGRPARAVRAVVKASRGQSQKPAEKTQDEEAKVTSRKRKAATCEHPPHQNEALCGPSRKLAAEERRPQSSTVLRGRHEAPKRIQGPECSTRLSKRIDRPLGVSVIKRTKKTMAKPGPMEAKLGPAETKLHRPPIRGKWGPSAQEDNLRKEFKEVGTSIHQKPVGGERTGEEEEAPEGCSRVNEGTALGRGPEVARGTIPAPLHRLELSARRRGKATDMEEDEGIHSHDGSDISDSVSEGSDDSGLHGIALVIAGVKSAGPSTTTTTPATTPATTPVSTPTEGPPNAPAVTKSGSHTCIFCDRTFKAEVEYRLHLNRHLVNVYYLESAAKGDQ